MVPFKLRILIIDDHPLFMDGISLVLKQLAARVEITKAETISAALALLNRQSDYDLILLDLSLPGLDGFSFLHRFSAEEFCIPVIVVSAEQQLGLIRQALEANVMGFIPKAYSADRMLIAIKQVLEGELFVPDDIKLLLGRTANSEHSSQLSAPVINSGISTKQYEVLKLIAKGYSNQTIAELLNRTEHTVKSHVAALFQILMVKSRTECVEAARKRGLLKAGNDVGV